MTKKYWIVFLQDPSKDSFYPDAHVFKHKPTADFKELATFVGVQEIEMEFLPND